jgi:phytoene/squalene synthetase
MLRDTYDDVRAGYYNIPGEVLRANDIQPWDMNSPAYCAWVEGRVGLARGCFQTGREYLSRVEEPRCRLAGLAYISRFEWLLDAIEAEGYRLRSRYSERKSLGTGLRMGLSIISSLLSSPRAERVPQPVVSHPLPDPKGLQDL